MDFIKNILIPIVCLILVAVSLTFGYLYWDTSDQLTSSKANISSLQGQLSTANNKITELETDLDMNQAEINSLNNQILSLQGEITELETDLDRIQDIVSIVEGDAELAGISVNSFLQYAASANPDAMYYLCHPDCQARFSNDLFIFRNRNGISTIQDSLSLSSYTLHAPQYTEEWNTYQSVFIFQADLVYEQNFLGSLVESILGFYNPDDYSCSITLYCIEVSDNDWKVYF
jgi:prefoldin subunit 5